MDGFNNDDKIQFWHIIGKKILKVFYKENDITLVSMYLFLK